MALIDRQFPMRLSGIPDDIAVLWTTCGAWVRERAFTWWLNGRRVQWTPITRQADNGKLYRLVREYPTGADMWALDANLRSKRVDQQYGVLANA